MPATVTLTPGDHVIHVYDESLPLGLFVRPRNEDQVLVTWGEDLRPTLEWLDEIRPVG